MSFDNTINWLRISLTLKETKFNTNSATKFDMCKFFGKGEKK